MKCTHCNSENIVYKVPVIDPFWATPIGPKYKKGGKGKKGMVHTAPTYIDFCGDCGTIIRSYIDVPTDAHWIHDKDRFADTDE